MGNGMSRAELIGTRWGQVSGDKFQIRRLNTN